MKHLLHPSIYALILALLGSASVLVAAETHSFLSYDEGLYSESPYLRPGKVDFLYKHRRDTETDQFNTFLWTPVFKGGGGVIDPTGAVNTRYGGGFFRPLAPWPDKGDLILGAQGVETGQTAIFEGQGEYRFPFGLGAGGGFVSTEAMSDVAFGKLSFRRKWKDWNYILEVQAQDNEYGRVGSIGINPRPVVVAHYHETHPGGYLAVFNDQVMFVGGHDGEQWRITGAYIAPESWKYVRPVIEALYVDNSIGQVVGPRVLFANASLKYEGGFLSHPARLGRAMGPQGLEFGNPLGFLNPTFNRRLEVWEEGSLADFRADRVELPNGIVQERYEGAFYPAQFQPARSIADGLFIGMAWIKEPTRDTPAVIGGVLTKIHFLQISIGIEHQVDPARTSVVFGLIDRF